MAQHGKDTVFLHDQYNLTSSLDSTSIDRSIAVLDTTVFGLDSRTYTPGQKDGSVSVEGFADPAAAGIDTILTNSFGSASTSVTVSLGQTFGSNAYLMDAIENQYSTSSSVIELVRITGEYQAAQDGVDAGVLICPVTTVTASSTCDKLNRGAGITSSSGAVAIIHVTAVSGTDPTLDAVVQMDTLNAFTSPTPLITFAQATAVTSQRVEVATSAEQYIRLSYTIGGTDTPTFTIAVSWAPR